MEERRMSRSTRIAFVVLVVAFVVTIVGSATPATPDAQARPTTITQRGWMSWYGNEFIGHRTACGKVLTERSLWVAALTPRLARCHMRLTIWARGKRYHVRVEDRGAWRRDGRVLDAAPGLRKRIGFNGVIRIRYTKGWH